MELRLGWFDVPLMGIEVLIHGSDLPSDIRDCLREAYLRVGQFVRNNPIPVSAIAPSGLATVYRSLRATEEAKLAPGNSFCERGRGFGVAALLAAMLKFRAYGVEAPHFESRYDSMEVIGSLFSHYNHVRLDSSLGF